MAYEGFELN